MSYAKTKNDGRTKNRNLEKERLRVAREKRLRENPPKYANVHPTVLEKGDDHPFSRKKVVQWIKTQKSLLASERGNVRRKNQRCRSKGCRPFCVYTSLRMVSKTWD